MNAIRRIENLEFSDEEVSQASALNVSNFTGEKTESIIMAIKYCQAAKIDPLLNVIHIVPMYVSDKVTGKKAYRDVIMPGVNLYRINAHRTGQYAGVSKKEYGETKKLTEGGRVIEYPEWASIIVKRVLSNGHIAEFESKILFNEFCSTSKDGNLNKTWREKPFFMLMKCAEAQALRMGFPEGCPGLTYEEMVGKNMGDYNDNEGHPRVVSDLEGKSETEKAKILLNKAPAKAEPPEAPQIELCKLIEERSIEKEQVGQWLKAAGIEHVGDFSDDQATKCVDWIKDNTTQ